MKTKKIIISSVWIATAALLWSCDDSNAVAPETPDNSSIANNILIGSSSALNRIRGNGFGGPIGAIYGNHSGRTAGKSGSPLAIMRNASRGRSYADSTDVSTPDCLIETWEDDGNGTYTFTLDFGDGCDYYGEFMKGKLVEIGTYTDNSFNSSVTYTDFGSSDWSIDGNYTYSGTWEDNLTNGTSQPADSSEWDFSASYEFTADLTQQYTDYGYPEDSTQASTGETIVTVDYEASGSEEMDQHGYTVNARTVAVSVSNGEAFTSSVDAPLYFDYTCQDDVWSYTTGIESGSYAFEDQTGSYSIDYGDGTCDNIISLTENGTTEVIDLGEEWDDWEEECGDDHND